MRLVVLLPVLICIAAPAYAEGARESRYGPTTPRQAAAAVAAATARYNGPMLGWANKQQGSAFVAAPNDAPDTPTPGAAWAASQSARAPAPPTAPAAFTPPPAPLPTSLYAAPTPSAPQPARQVAAAIATAAGPGARFYSVGREYGLTPDAIPPVGPDTRVLITASEPTPDPGEAAPVHGSADWLAAGARGDDEDDDGDSRKTRKQSQ